MQGGGREQPHIVALALRTKVVVEPGGDGWRSAQPMLGRHDQEGRRSTGKPGSARREPLELPLSGDPGQGA